MILEETVTNAQLDNQIFLEQFSNSEHNYLSLYNHYAYQIFSREREKTNVFFCCFFCSQIFSRERKRSVFFCCFLLLFRTEARGGAKRKRHPTHPIPTFPQPDALWCHWLKCDFVWSKTDWFTSKIQSEKIGKAKVYTYSLKKQASCL